MKRAAARPAFLALAWLVVGPGPRPLWAQESRSCTLVLRPTEATHSVAERAAGGGYITHIGGGMTWTCGDARMTADSAVKIDPESLVRMIGDVHYRDTIRTLDSRLLDYYQAQRRVVAMQDVRLTRLSSGAKLRGPRAEFLRSATGELERTVATGRPHITLPPKGAGALPFQIDADSAVFVGDVRAVAVGDVRIERGELSARSRRAEFEFGRELARLYGEPVVTNPEARLSGDSIFLWLSEQELRKVESMGSAEAVGESFDVRGPRIDAAFREKRLDQLWAHGEGRSGARSGDLRLLGDSLRFALVEGRLDSVIAVGSASGVQGDSTGELLAEPSLDVPGPRDWITGDTLRAAFVPAGDSTERTARPDTAGPVTTASADSGTAEDTTARRVTIRTLRSIGDARSYYSAVRDSAQASRPSHNYLVGKSIELVFKDGQVADVNAEEAIGVYLEPESAGEPAPASPGSAGEVPGTEGASPSGQPPPRGSGRTEP